MGEVSVMKSYYLTFFGVVIIGVFLSLIIPNINLDEFKAQCVNCWDFIEDDEIDYISMGLIEEGKDNRVIIICSDCKNDFKNLNSTRIVHFLCDLGWDEKNLEKARIAIEYYKSKSIHAKIAGF
jgi:hypothetical protein